MSRRVTLYTKKGCHPCEEAKELLLGLREEYDLAIREVDIESAKGLEKIYGSLIPVVALEGGKVFHSKITESQIRQALGEPVRKIMPSGTTAIQIRERERDLVLFLNRLILGIANHWLLLLNTLVGLYVGLPVLAPLLMARGQTGLSNLIYFAYRFVCHQMPSRSFFIAGHQMAMCQRDVAIYGSIFIAGLAFNLVRRRLKPLSWQAFVLLVTPMAVDGTLQLLGVLESTPLRRLVTGSLFGLACVLLAFPYLEEGFQEIREEVAAQLNKAKERYKREGEPI
ncbi:MAG: DUF2085 domain-containing protein [Anaerolineae bacterium]|nr:DUF2085 domain-containing protein [Anaerolineae bacterium]